MRRFNPTWFKEYKWLEYSKEKDAVYYLYCYLFKLDIGNKAGGETFVTEGFSNWKKKEKFKGHVGAHNSAHNQARQKCEALLNHKQSIITFFDKQSDQQKMIYRTCLNASVDCIRFLQQQRLAFHGHDESKDSTNQGNFRELLRFLATHNEEIDKVVLKNAPENHQMTAPYIQKDIANAAASETIDAILKDLGDSSFAILVYESRDISIKQLAIVLRYVDKRGHVMERFLGITHVSTTTVAELKKTIDSVLSKHNLSISRFQGQGYDGASNMRGELNGLKTLILNDNSSTYYVHCFAHQLQLTLVAVAKNHIQIATFFSLVNSIFNVIGASCKCRDVLREKRTAEVVEALQNNEMPTSRGLNQEMNIKRPGDTRWSSYYGAIISLFTMFSSVIDTVEDVIEDGLNSEQRAEANILIQSLQTFDFAFNLHLMKNVLGITNELSQALQRKDQDILNAMKLVEISKLRLQAMIEDGWDSLFEEVLNMQLQELNSRFNEANSELLLCVACLSPDDMFASFNKEKLLRLAQFYPNDFSAVQLITLDNQLETYIVDMRSSDEFATLKGIGQLAKKLVEMKKDVVYQLVYSLVTLSLILPVAIASVERAFSAMNIVKNCLRNRIGDQWMNDCLVTYIEKDIFKTISYKEIMKRFQDIKTRRGQLP
ncbi:uncharacterized protein LOC132185494 [Corylus avellana]|uniref:uncharacterized protein LOC132185494 n=1 Tax=Corylus avellana TaxID=13451 RepID=UPI00286ADE70|nr:uncharacterized protein LOC132185494 [Corylus avellana]